MTATINASTSSGVILTSDTSGNLDFQSNGTSKVSVTSGVTTIASLSVTAYTPTASLLTSGTAVASTSGTSIDFTSIPSWVKRITVMFSGVSTSGTSNYLVQIGSGSVTTSGYTGQTNSGGGISANSAGFIVCNNIGSASLYVGSITILLFNSNTYVESGLVGPTTGAASMATSVGAVTLGGVLDRVRVTTVNGTDTFDAGSINIMYE
jgi:hypothetical protein